MKAVVYTKYGSPDVLQLKEVEKPTPRENEVLVRVYASSVNSWDWDQLRGKHFIIRLIGGLFRPRHKVLGADVAGRVEAIGKNVTEFQPGDDVFGDIATCGFGGFAEYVSVPEKYLAKKSQSMTFEQAAALPQAGLLALQGLHYKGLVKQGQKILINGAGGGVGTIALQYAKSLGAEVSCVDHAGKFDLLQSLGADQLIDYKKENYTRIGQYDVILDVTANQSLSDYQRALKPGGRFVMIGGSLGGLLLQMVLIAPCVSVFGNKKFGLMGYKPNRNDLDQLTRLFEDGKLIPIIDKCFGLDEVPAALRYFGQGQFKGKIVISIGKESHGKNQDPGTK